MGLKHDLQTARKKLAALDRGERESLMQICADIYGAQQALTEKAAPLLDQCMTRCQGLCCRNIRVAEIITKWDLIYILAMRPELGSRMASCLEKEDLFAADCLFLENGTGPCLFPAYVRPERCIISFCRVEPLVEKEIAQVMKGFSRLIRFFLFRPWHRFRRRFLPVAASAPDRR
ncbi:uncharacterized protein Dvar_29740 [Desulfosarcina variabilis str. Montpellier]|uniref:hypothetical protein n=1 Tax=Desulfosarcina variabilis TaxID=2300 RepID=UPI003AFA219D